MDDIGCINLCCGIRFVSLLINFMEDRAGYSFQRKLGFLSLVSTKLREGVFELQFICLSFYWYGLIKVTPCRPSVFLCISPSVWLELHLPSTTFKGRGHLKLRLLEMFIRVQVQQLDRWRHKYVWVTRLSTMPTVETIEK